MKRYEEIKIELLILAQQDIVTQSGFDGEDDEFFNPNESGNSKSFSN